MKKKGDYWILISLLPIFQPKLFTQYELSANLYVIFNVINFFMLLLTSIKNNKISKTLLFWVVYRIYLLFIMMITNNYSGILQWGSLSIMVSSLIMIFDLVKFNNQQKSLIMYISIIGLLFLCINYISLLTLERGFIKSTYYDNANNDYYFLGIKTNFTTFIFPTIAASFLFYKKYNSRLSKFLFISSIVFSFLNIFTKNISTAIVGIILIIMLVVLVYKFKLKINYKLLIYCIIFFQFVFIAFNLSTYFSWFFINVLHKDATLTARIFIWNNAIELLTNSNLFNLIFGSGCVNGNAYVPYDGGLWQPHSQLLVWLYNGGVIGTLIIVNFLSSFFKYENDKIIEFVKIISVVELFLTLTEGYFEVGICYVTFLLVLYMSFDGKEMSYE